MLARYTKTNSKLKSQKSKVKKAKMAVVTTAVPLTKEQEGEIESWIKKNLGSDVKIQKAVDPKVIAGIRVRAGDWLFDGTFASELERAKQFLSQS